MQVLVWNEAEWHVFRHLYEQLLVKSSADRLFLSWDWLDLWWKHLARQPGDAFRTYVLVERGQLIGAMPVLVGQRKRRGMYVRAVTLLGASVRESRGIFSEYLDVVAVRGREDEVRNACLREIRTQEKCQELAISATRRFTEWADALRKSSGLSLFTYARVIDPVTGYQADLTGGFSQYLASLSGNARRSLYNLRRRLQQKGDTRLEPIREPFAQALVELDAMRRKRWGAGFFDGATLGFYRDLGERWGDGDAIQPYRLLVGGQCVAVVIDLRRGDVQYNMQMAFDESFDPSVSLGLITLGYAMEQAAADGVRTYEMLLGPGRNTDYKGHIASRTCQVATVQCFTTPMLANFYRIYDGLKRLTGLRTPRAFFADTGERRRDTPALNPAACGSAGWRRSSSPR
jgi:CelD/BcsL family acetyltransferase involved in cellulose biosynthesis